MIPYTPQTWADGPGGATPISAARLSHIEAGVAAALLSPFAPAAAIAESFPRVAGANNTVALTSGRMHLVAVPLMAGQVVTSLTFVSSGAAVTPTHWWFALYTPALALCAQTADQLTAAWTSATAKTVALAAPFTVPTSGLYYAAVMSAAATPPTLLAGNTIGSPVLTMPPVLTGTSTSSLAGTAPGTAAALTAAQNSPYAYAT